MATTDLDFDFWGYKIILYREIKEYSFGPKNLSTENLKSDETDFSNIFQVDL